MWAKSFLYSPSGTSSSLEESAVTDANGNFNFSQKRKDVSKFYIEFKANENFYANPAIHTIYSDSLQIPTDEPLYVIQKLYPVSYITIHAKNVNNPNIEDDAFIDIKLISWLSIFCYYSYIADRTETFQVNGNTSHEIRKSIYKFDSPSQYEYDTIFFPAHDTVYYDFFY